MRWVQWSGRYGRTHEMVGRALEQAGTGKRVVVMVGPGGLNPTYRTALAAAGVKVVDLGKDGVAGKRGAGVVFEEPLR